MAESGIDGQEGETEALRGIQPRTLKRYELGLAAGWTVAILALFAINVLHEHTQTLETARTQARSNFQRDVSYRQWNAASGSVYVEVSKTTQPNPYLAHIPDRDVTTTGGKRLTLVNPAYMTRLVFDLAARGSEVKGHITSLRPARPQNLPDGWEARALRAFAKGETEVSSVDEISGVSYLRLMSPLSTERACLRCHDKDGYRLGDIRGGISVAVPMEPLWKIFWQNVLLCLLSFLLLWLAGLAGIFIGGRRLARTIRQRDLAEERIAELNRNLLAKTGELQVANQELECFCATVSHDLRSPLTGIAGYCQLVEMLPDAEHPESCRQLVGIMLQETLRMSTLIDTLLEFSRVTRGELVREALELSAMARDISLELQLADPTRRVQFVIASGVTGAGDPALLAVVLQNLLGNSWKYAGKREQAVIEFGALGDGDAKVYFVRDNGIGFDQAENGKMFEAFSRLANTGDFEGNGVGLATVKRIVTRHQGRIWCEGELDRGATFYFTLCQGNKGVSA